MEDKTMMVEIWSDVACPFCYIGKRKFEAALSQFEEQNRLKLVWKSFQLSPNMKTEPGKNIHEYLAEHKGIGLAQAKEMNRRVSEMAKQVGLIYNFDVSVAANSFDAHRFSHMAKAQGLQDAAEEKLFAAYFTEGKNIADHQVLIQMGAAIGMEASALQQELDSNKYADDVKADISEAGELGINGVPFFVFDRKYAISGAQDSALFLETLKKAFTEWEMKQA